MGWRFELRETCRCYETSSTCAGGRPIAAVDDDRPFDDVWILCHSANQFFGVVRLWQTERLIFLFANQFGRVHAQVLQQLGNRLFIGR